jgi:mannosyl-oligosaccharide alpha-1,2-mannosidase
MMYNLTKTGLSPEIAYFDEGSNAEEYQIRPADAHNLLRPEFVESLFYLYHITGDQKYRTWGWNVSIQWIF